MGNGTSSLAAPAPPAATPAPAPVPVPAEPVEAFPLDLATAHGYLGDKVPVAVGVGGLLGVTRGYYVGELAAMYGYSGAFGLGMCSTAFYGTAYLLRHARQRDDMTNFALSGSINGLWVVAGVTRSLPRGLVGAAVGAAVGAGVKVGGDWIYETSREAWLSHRAHRLEFSRPRLLESRKPMFSPADSRLGKGDILPPSQRQRQQQQQQLTKESLSPPPPSPKCTGDSAPPGRKGGWFW